MSGDAAPLNSLTTPNGLPLVGPFVGGTVLLIAICTHPSCAAAAAVAAVDCSDFVQNWAFTVAASIIGMFFSASGLALMMFAKAINEKHLFEAGKLGPVNVGRFLSWFLFVWWAIAAGIITFQAPFIFASNGYFGAVRHEQSDP